MNASVLAAPVVGGRFSARRAATWCAIAGVVYVGSWLVGLLVAPSAPAATAAAPAVHAYYAEGASRILFQASLVHGLAGLALAVLAVGVARVTDNGRRHRFTIVLAGLAAAAASLAQLSFAIAATRDVANTAAGTSRAFFSAINVTDTAKLMLLAVFVAAVTLALKNVGIAPRWLTAAAALLVVLLPLGGASFVVSASVLVAALYVSLPLLLVWVAGTSGVIARRYR